MLKIGRCLSGTRQPVRLLLGLTLVLVASGLLPAVAPPAQAQNGETYYAYIPWVPSNETIGGQGPWFGLVSIQNRTDDFCSFQVFVVDRNDTGQIDWVSRNGLSLFEGESRSLSASGMNLPEPGSPVRIEATCDIAVSLKQYSPNVRRTPWSDGSQVVAGYAGLSPSDLAAARASATSAWHLPIVQTNSDWNTFIRIANFATTATAVTVEIYPSGNTEGSDGVALTLERQLGYTESATIDLLSELGVSGFVGFARITATGDVGVVAQRVKPGALMAISNVAVAADGSVEGSYQSAAPLLFTAYNGWNTGITMANASDQPAIVTLQYFPTGGSMLREESLVIPGRSMQYIYTPGTVDQEGFVGSANIISNLPIIAAVDEVKYETFEALSYIASGVPQHVAGIPIVFKEDPANGYNDNSGVSIVNLDPVNEQAVFLRVRNRAGIEILELPLAVRLPAGGSSFVYLPFIDEIPAGTNGSLLIETNSEAGFIAISNDVNYVAGGDGSVVFSASGNGGLYYIPVPEQ
jgi:hypothetical protein